MKEDMQNEVVEVVKDIPDNFFNEPLIKNPKPLKKISREEVDKIKAKNKKKHIETIEPPKPITPTNKLTEEEVDKIKNRNKRKSTKFK